MIRGTIWIALLVAAGACSPGDESDSPPGNARRFVEAEDGVVRDSRTGLLWTARDAGRELPWDEAQRRCRELALGEGRSWRLPSVEDLAAVYDESQSQPCGDGSCRVDSAIDLTSPYQWSGTARGEGRRVYFDFRHGSELAPRLRPGLGRGTLCVASPPGR